MTLERYNEIVNQINNATNDIVPSYLQTYLRHKYIKQIISVNNLNEDDNSTYALVDLYEPNLYKHTYRTLEKLPSGANKEEDLYNVLSIISINELKNDMVFSNLSRYELLNREDRIIGFLE